MTAINCRAKVSQDCYDGRDERSIYGSDGQASDGTWDGDSVVCDACYLTLGQPLLPQLEAAIAMAQKR